MNFIKKIGIAAALFGSVTVANAQITSSGGSATPSVTLPITAKVAAVNTITVTSKSLKVDKVAGTTSPVSASFAGTANAVVGAYIGKAEVKTNLPSWDVWVTADNGLKLRSGTTGTNYLGCLKGGTVSDADVVLRTCYFKGAVSATDGDCSSAYLKGTGASLGGELIPDTYVAKGTESFGLSELLNSGDLFVGTDLSSQVGTFVFTAGVACPYNNLFSGVATTGAFQETLTITLTSGF